MPYKSLAQSRFLHSQHPELAARWDKEYPNQKSLPEYVGKKKGGYVDDFIGYKRGGIHINPANKGKFTATKKATGKSTEELTHSKNPLTKKRAVFAENAKHWNHKKDGGTVTSDSTQAPAPKPSYWDTDIFKTPIKAHKPVEKKSEGGYIEGEGTSTSDSINAKVKSGSFVVPAENAFMADQLSSQYFGKSKKQKAKLNQSGGSPVHLSNGEYLFSPKETKVLAKKININSLAPKASKPFNFKNF